MTSSSALRSIAEIRQHFASNRASIVFINPTNYNLYGAEQWIAGLKHIVAVDGYDGRNSSVFAPAQGRPGGYGDLGIADVNDYLLGHPEVHAALAQLSEPQALMMMFEPSTEALARDLRLRILFPPAALRNAFDDKLGTVRLGNRAGVPSVPNVLAPVRSYRELREVAGHLGEQLVVQTAFGYSGHTTYFISSEADFAEHAEAIAAEAEVKVMKRIRARSLAIEGCATASGVVVGPLMTEVIGHPTLTPYRGGWCGNELLAGVFDTATRKQARDHVERLGAQLYREGYRGYFELDLLLDEDDGQLYLGELNPRLTGASPMTNLGAYARANVPLYLFHLLEWTGVPFELDLAALNDGWAVPAEDDAWSQMIIGHTEVDSADAAAVPASGIWHLDEFSGACRCVRDDLDREAVRGDAEGFFVRTIAAGSRVEPGTVLGRLMLRGRVQNDQGRLTERAERWITGIKAAFDLRS